MTENMDVVENRIDQMQKKKALEMKYDLRPGNNRIGNIWRYDHKVTSAVGVLLVSMAVITRQSIYSYLYVIGGIKVVKDTINSAFDHQSNLVLEKTTTKPLIYYLVAASIIFVAALTTNHFIPGINGGITYYAAQVIP